MMLRRDRRLRGAEGIGWVIAPRGKSGFEGIPQTKPISRLVVRLNPLA